MAFKKTQKPTFTATVTVNIPNDLGSYDKSTFTARFKRMPESLRKIWGAMTDAELARTALVGWDMTDEETNETVPFTAEALEVVLDIAPTPHAIAIAFWETVSGARAKN